MSIDRRASPAWVLALGLVGACSAPREEVASPEHAVGAVVYGGDGRLDWYAIEDAPLKAQARDSVAAMIPWSAISSDETGAVLIDGEPTLGESYGLCADQRFRDQPTAGTCSGTLIDDDLLLTAGHCVPRSSSCASSAWVFDYLYEAEGVRAPMDEDSVYRCVDVIVRPEIDLDDDLDLSIIQLDRPVAGRTPAPMAGSGALALGAPLVLVGYPNGIPLKVDAGGIVDAPRTQAGDYFIASVDAFSGNSGSGVLDKDLAVVGVLVSGADDYEYADTCAVVAVLDPDDAEEAVMYAHHAHEALCARGFPSARLCPDGPAASCGDGFCTSGETPESCPDDCDGLFAVPAEWTCSAAWYDAGDDCDCDCGAYDPDCDDRTLDVVNCAPGSSCDKKGQCTEPIPAEWTCSRSSYADGDRCHCDCGVPDPDCADPRNDLSGCAPGGICQEDGTCTITLPDEWECRRRFYGTGDGCDCDCGAYDPDCADPGQQVYGCLAGSACLEDGTCEQPVPAGWVCGWSTYAAGDECDCNCGLYDPDCDVSSRVRNCGSGQVCSDDGSCVEREEVEPDPEPTPEPAPEVGPEPMPEEVEDEVEPVVESITEDEADVSEPDDDGDSADEDDAQGDVAEARAETGSGGRRDDGCAGGGGSGALYLMGLVVMLMRGRGASSRARARR